MFDLILYIRSTIFQLNRDGSSWVDPVLSYDKCVLLKDHNALTQIRLEPAASRSRIKHLTMEPLRSLRSSSNSGSNSSNNSSSGTITTCLLLLTAYLLLLATYLL